MDNKRFSRWTITAPDRFFHCKGDFGLPIFHPQSPSFRYEFFRTRWGSGPPRSQRGARCLYQNYFDLHWSTNGLGSRGDVNWRDIDKVGFTGVWTVGDGETRGTVSRHDRDEDVEAWRRNLSECRTKRMYYRRLTDRVDEWIVSEYQFRTLLLRVGIQRSWVQGRQESEPIGGLTDNSTEDPWHFRGVWVVGFTWC